MAEKVVFDRDADGSIVSARLTDDRAKATAKGKGPMRIILNALIALRDPLSVSVTRLSAIENRLAALDGGPEAELATQIAYDRVNDARLQAGQKPLTSPRPVVEAKLKRVV